MSKIFLGLDCSTQSLTALLVEKSPDGTRILHEESLNFERDLPEFGTRSGVLPGTGGEAHTPPQLWVKALEKIFAALHAKGLPLRDILAIGTSGQQHGSVYLNASAESALVAADPAKPLSAQLEGIYSRATSPIWMDSTTSEECREITEALGGDDAVCSLTGSRAYERFTGPQIRKFFKQEPENYARTRHICLVSSFLPSLLAGRIVPIDAGDGAGMNLMDIASIKWSEKALEATAPGLREKLLPVTLSGSWSTPIADYFVKRFGLDPQCRVLPGTGDNPSSLVGLGLVSSGRIGISLGTSDTLFAFMSQVKTDPLGQSHVFASPTGNYMAISVYKNGSLAREAVRNQCGLDWKGFSELLEAGSPGNAGRFMLPYFDTEIIPRVQRPRVRRFGYAVEDKAVEVRAVVEAQMLSMRLHSEWMGEKPARIHVTGGASANDSILQVMADTFGVPVFRQETANAAALGAALRAVHFEAEQGGKPVSWESVVSPFLGFDAATAEPDREAHLALTALMEKYRQAEREFLREG